MCAKRDRQLQTKGRWESESWQPITAILGWVFARWREKKASSPPF